MFPMEISSLSSLSNVQYTPYSTVVNEFLFTEFKIELLSMYTMYRTIERS